MKFPNPTFHKTNDCIVTSKIWPSLCHCLHPWDLNHHPSALRQLPQKAQGFWKWFASSSFWSSHLPMPPSRFCPTASPSVLKWQQWAPLPFGGWLDGPPECQNGLPSLPWSIRWVVFWGLIITPVSHHMIARFALYNMYVKCVGKYMVIAYCLDGMDQCSHWFLVRVDIFINCW